MKLTISNSLIICSLLLLESVSGQTVDEAEAVTSTGDLPTEIVVTPTMSLKELRNLIIDAEEDLFGKFNALNDDDDYNIECMSYARTGTHIPTRFCVPNFLVAARAENAADVAFSFWTDPYGHPFLLSDRAMVNELSSEYKILQRKMEEFAEQDPEFREAAAILILLQREIQARRQGRRGR